ncbi:MAG: tetratricopeptide repeat protein, partial [Bacteroidota bacterium]
SMRILLIAIILILSLLLGWGVVKAQSHTERSRSVDSLKQVIATAEHDTTRIKLLNEEIGYLYENYSPDSAIMYYTHAIAIADKNLSGSSLTSLADAFSSLKAKSLLYIGIVHHNQGSYDKAISYYLKSLKIREKLGDKKGVSGCYNNIGIVHQEQGSYNKAISYYLKSLKIYEELGDKQGMAGSYNNIGNVHNCQGSYDKAIEYYLKFLKIEEELGNKKAMSDSYNNIGGVYQMQNCYNKAIEYHLKSLKISEELGDKQGMSASYNNIGLVHKEQGNYAKAIEYYLKSLKIEEELGDKNGMAIVYDNIAGLNVTLVDSAAMSEGQRIGYLNKAIEFGNKGYKLAKEIGAMLLEQNAANYLMDAYTKLGKYKKAIEFAEIFIATKNGLFNEEKTKELANLEAKYEYEKQKAIDDANNEKLLAIEKEQQAKQKVISYAIAVGLVLVVIFLIFVFNRLRLTRKQKRVIEEQKKQVVDAYDELEEKNTEILDSINYAKRIQSAILPPSKVVKEYLKESFILYKPKDIVAGDFYWLEHKDGKVLFAVADCTGHGVPGAMVSVICNNGLNRSVREFSLTEPGKILEKTREIVIQEFEKSEEEVKDGMDIALCSLEFPSEKERNVKLQYAGANNPLWIIRNGEILETKANKQPIGKFDNPEPYTTHSFELQKGDSLYIFSDGYVDQFGGENGKKFKAKAFRELLLSIQNEPMEEQRLLIDESFENWRGKLEQIDDVCIIGVKILTKKKRSSQPVTPI